MLVLPVEFEDRIFVPDAGPEAEVAQVQAYFDRQFDGVRTFRFDLAPTVLLPFPVARYGNNRPDRRDVHLGDAVRTACTQAAEHVDFKEFDGDQDGVVDLVCLLFPGPAEGFGGGEDDLWPQYGRLSSLLGSHFFLQGKRLDPFIACPAGLPGILAHELGHALGLNDLYDTDGESSGGTTRGLWGLSLMDDGCRDERIPDFTAVEYEAFGLGRRDTLRTGRYTLSPLEMGKRYAMIPTEREGEHFLFEARAGGLLVYHIDRSDAPAGHCERLGVDLTARERWESNAINDNPAHPCARILPADPEAATPGEAVFPQADRSSLGSDTPTPLRGWSGEAPGLALTDIRADATGTVSFEVIEPVTLADLSVYQDAAVVRWQVAEGLAVRSCEVFCTDGGDSLFVRPRPDATSCTLEGLHPQTAYRFSVTVQGAGSDRFSVGGAFTTKVYRNGTYPYIYLNGVTRNADGSFPAGSRIALRVFNATGVQEIRWTLDGAPVSPDADGYYSLTRPGLLRARILYADGTTETLFKQIVVR